MSSMREEKVGTDFELEIQDSRHLREGTERGEEEGGGEAGEREEGGV